MTNPTSNCTNTHAVCLLSCAHSSFYAFFPLCTRSRLLQTVPKTFSVLSKVTTLTWLLAWMQWDSFLVRKQRTSRLEVKYRASSEKLNSRVIFYFKTLSVCTLRRSGNLTLQAKILNLEKLCLSHMAWQCEASFLALSVWMNVTDVIFSGASVATALGKGFLAVRKAGHLCVPTQGQSYTDYTGREKTMEVRLDVLRPG